MDGRNLIPQDYEEASEFLGLTVLRFVSENAKHPIDLEKVKETIPPIIMHTNNSHSGLGTTG